MATDLPQSSSVTVYTCITGGREVLRNDQVTSESPFIAYVDRPWHSSVWCEREASTQFASARRNARLHKILSHQFIDTPYSVWLDGNVAMKMPPAQLIAEWIGDYDIATFKHRTRDCTYDEGEACLAKQLDSRTLIQNQMAKYQRAGFSSGAGLPETCVIVRRQSTRVEQFNNAWWSELCRFSVRDQLGFMYAAQNTGVKVRFITPTKYQHPGFEITNRPAGPEPEHNLRSL